MRSYCTILSNDFSICGGGKSAYATFIITQSRIKLGILEKLLSQNSNVAIKKNHNQLIIEFTVYKIE